MSIALYAGFAVLMLSAAEGLDVLRPGFVDVAIWVLTAYFAVGIGMNALSRSRPERLVRTPAVVVLAVVCLVLALQG